MQGCKKYQETGYCHCGLYTNATKEAKEKIIKKLKEKKGHCPCNFIISEETYCHGWENFELEETNERVDE